jgi:two-component system, NarL family, response regulator YdfI
VIRVLVAAPQDVVRAGLEALVASDPAFTIVGRSRGGAALIRDISDATPDVVLLELGWQAHEVEWSALPHDELTHIPALVVLSDDAQGAWVGPSLRAGVHAVLPRDATAGEILTAMHGASTGLVVLPALTIASLLAGQPVPARTPTTSTGQTLTAREIEVLRMLAEGLGNKMIARELGISDHTVKFHVGSILTKLGAASRTEAVTLGARQGLISL